MFHSTAALLKGCRLVFLPFLFLRGSAYNPHFDSRQLRQLRQEEGYTFTTTTYIYILIFYYYFFLGSFFCRAAVAAVLAVLLKK